MAACHRARLRASAALTANPPSAIGRNALAAKTHMCVSLPSSRSPSDRCRRRARNYAPSSRPSRGLTYINLVQNGPCLGTVPLGVPSGQVAIRVEGALRHGPEHHRTGHVRTDWSYTAKVEGPCNSMGVNWPSGLIVMPLILTCVEIRCPNGPIHLIACRVGLGH